jgi:hypothetical protein
MSTTNDRQVGYGLLFGLLGVGGAFVMYVASVNGNQPLSGLAFGAAVLAGALAVAAVHLYGE